MPVLRNQRERDDATPDDGTPSAYSDETATTDANHSRLHPWLIAALVVAIAWFGYFLVRLVAYRLTPDLAFADWAAFDKGSEPLRRIARAITDRHNDIFRPLPELFFAASKALFGVSKWPIVIGVVVLHIVGAWLTAEVFCRVGFERATAYLAAVLVLFSGLVLQTDLCLVYNQAAFAKVFSAALLLHLLHRPRFYLWLPLLVCAAMCHEQYLVIGPLLWVCLARQHGIAAAFRGLVSRRYLPFVVAFTLLAVASVVRYFWVAAANEHVAHPVAASGVVEVVRIYSALVGRHWLALGAPDPAHQHLYRPLGVLATVSFVGAALLAFVRNRRAFAAVALFCLAWFWAALLVNLPSVVGAKPYTMLTALHGPALFVAWCFARVSWSSEMPHHWRAVSTIALLALLTPIGARWLDHDHPNAHTGSSQILALVHEAEASAGRLPDRLYLVEGRAGPTSEERVPEYVSAFSDGSDQNWAFFETFGERAIPATLLRARHAALFCPRAGDLGVSAYPAQNDLGQGVWRLERIPTCREDIAEMHLALSSRFSTEVSADDRARAAAFLGLAAAFERAYLAGEDDSAARIASELDGALREWANPPPSARAFHEVVTAIGMRPDFEDPDHRIVFLPFEPGPLEESSGSVPADGVSGG